MENSGEPRRAATKKEKGERMIKVKVIGCGGYGGLGIVEKKGRE